MEPQLSPIFLNVYEQLFAVFAKPYTHETPPIGKNHQSSKIAVTFEQMSKFKILQDLEYPKAVQHSLFYNCLPYILPFGLDNTINTAGEEEDSFNELLLTTVFVEQPMASPGCAKDWDPMFLLRAISLYE